MALTERVTTKQFRDRLARAARQAELKGARFPDDTAAKQLRRRAEAVVLPERFDQIYLPHYFRERPAGFHVEMYRAIEASKRVCVIAPRGHAKSTVTTMAYTLHQVVCAPVLKAWVDGTLEASDPEMYGAIREVMREELERRLVEAERDHAQDPGLFDADYVEVARQLRDAGEIGLYWDPYIQVGAVTEQTAEGLLFDVKFELENNERILSDWGEQVDDPGRNYADFVSKTDVRVRAFGSGTAVRGGRHRQWRPTLVILDDPDDKKTVGTREIRDAQQKWLTATVRYGLEPKVGRVFVVGTKLHGDCLVARIHKPDQFKGWTKIFYRAIQDDGTALWPERWSLDELLEARTEDPDAFEQEMQNNPVSDEERPFPELFYYSRKSYVGRLPTVMVLDPSLGKTEKSDWQALAVMRYSPRDAKFLIHRCELTRLPPPDLVTHFLRVYREEKPDIAAIETIGFQLLLEAMIVAEGKVTHTLPAIERIEGHSESKTLRIASMAPLARQKVLLFPDDGSCRRGERQFLDQPGGKRDFPDVVEMCIRLLRRLMQLQAGGGLARLIESVRGRAAEFGAGAW